MKTNFFSKIRAATIGTFLLIGLLLVIPGYFFLYPQIFYCQLIDFSGFEKVSSHIYASPALTKKQRKHVPAVIKMAEMRIDSFYNGKQAEPKIVVCGTTQEYRKYCQSTEGAGCSLGTPWGQSYVILNGSGLNVDVTSHEMSHVELLKRLGWWKTTMEIPQWFNEGIALMLDKRFVGNSNPIGRYYDYIDEWLYLTGGGQNILELEDITSVKGFFAGNQKHVMLAYMTSGLEVSHWMVFGGKLSLSKLLDEVKKGHPFEDSYRQIETRSKSKKRLKLPPNPLHTRYLDKNNE